MRWQSSRFAASRWSSNRWGGAQEIATATGGYHRKHGRKKREEEQQRHISTENLPLHWRPGFNVPKPANEPTETPAPSSSRPERVGRLPSAASAASALPPTTQPIIIVDSMGNVAISGDHEGIIGDDDAIPIMLLLNDMIQ